MLLSILFSSFHNRHHPQIHITQLTKLAARGTGSNLKEQDLFLASENSVFQWLQPGGWGAAQRLSDLRDFNGPPALTRRGLKGNSLKKHQTLAPQSQQGKTTGREPTLWHFLGWLGKDRGEFRKGHNSMEVGRLLTLATSFLGTRIFQSTAAPMSSGTGKKEWLYAVSSFFLSC